MFLFIFNSQTNYIEIQYLPKNYNDFKTIRLKIDKIEYDFDDNEFLLPEDMIGNIKDIIFKRNLLNVARETNETPIENLVR